MKNRFRLGLLAVITALMCAACGHHHNNAPTVGYVRVVNATKATNLSLVGTNTASGSTAQTIASGVASGAASSYAAVGTGTVTLAASADSLTASSSSAIGISQNIYYTIFAYKRNGAVNLLILSDNTTAPATGYAELNIGNPAPDAGPLDVYVVSPNTVIDDTVTPKFQNVSSGGSTLIQSIAAGSYDIVVTAYNKPNDVRLTISNISLVDQEIAALMLTNTDGGALVDGTLVQQNTTVSQGGGITAYPNPDARIRLVGAFAGLYRLDYSATGSITDSVISSGIGANGYKVVPAGTTVASVALTPSGSTAVAATQSGASLLPLNTPLVAGNEYSLLVYGDMTAPSSQLIADNNQAPTAARIRTINVISWPGNTPFNVVSLYNSSVSLYTQPVGYEQVSPYAGLTTGISHLNAQVAALSPNSVVTIQDGKNIALGGVYTLIMGGSNTAFNDALILDRCLPTFTC